VCCDFLCVHGRAVREKNEKKGVAAHLTPHSRSWLW
jgi:hypothetical protein